MKKKWKLYENTLYFIKFQNGDEVYTKFIKNKKTRYMYKPMVIKNISRNIDGNMLWMVLTGPYIALDGVEEHLFEFNDDQFMLVSDNVSLERITKYHDFWEKIESGEYGLNKVVGPNENSDESNEKPTLH